MYHVFPKEATVRIERLANSGHSAPETCTNRTMRKQPVTAHSTKYPNSAAEQKSSCPVKHGDSKKPVENSQPKQVVKPAEDRRPAKERSPEERAALLSFSKPANQQKPKSVCRPPGSVGMSRSRPSPNEALRQQSQQSQKSQKSQKSQHKVGTTAKRAILPVNLSGKAQPKTVIGSGIKDYPFPFQMQEIESVEYYDGVLLVCFGNKGNYNGMDYISNLT